jgi:hypothetical protein
MIPVVPVVSAVVDCGGLNMASLSGGDDDTPE